MFFLNKKKRRNKSAFGASDGMTLMIVPHSQNNIIQIRLNYRIIYFILALIVTLTTLALASFLTVNHFKAERKVVEAKAQGWNFKVDYFDRSQAKLIERIKHISVQGDRLYRKIWPQGYEAKKFETSEVSPSIYLNKSSDRLNYVLKFLLNREIQLQGLPLGWPTKVGVITSTYGPRNNAFGMNKEFHNGYDFASRHGTKIYATAAGKILKAGGGTEGGLGRQIRILHPHGFVSVYGHCSKVLVKEKQHVKKGQLIGLVGRTGNATGSHVHYEVLLRTRDKPYPYEYTLNPKHFFQISL